MLVASHRKPTRFEPFLGFDPRPLSQMPVDVHRDGDTVVVEADLPGFEADQIDVKVERNLLSISARREIARDRAAEGYFVSERRRGSLRRHLNLGDGLDTSRLTATYVNGVLRIEVPVAEASKPRKVEVTSPSAPITIPGEAVGKSDTESAPENLTDSGEQ